LICCHRIHSVLLRCGISLAARSMDT